MRLGFAVALAVASLAGSSAQNVKPKATKATKAFPPVTFEAHNEGSVEGPIYGEANLVTVIIDRAGIQYKDKTMGKPAFIPWDQVIGWQPNNFTSKSPSKGVGGDYGIGVYQGARYFSFRTRNGRDYLAAVRALRELAPLKERAGIG